MRLKWIWVLSVIALAGFALAAGGCGGKGGSTTTVTVESAMTDTTETATTMTETAETDTTVTDTTETATTVTDTTSTETTSTDAEASGTDTTGTPDLSFISSDNCREFAQLASSYASALSGAGGTDMEQAAQALQEFADKAPDEIKDDFQTLADAYSKIADALQGTDLSSGQAPSADAIAKLQQLSSQIDSAKVAAASSNISAWVTQNCTTSGG
jgi:hypothetical protein